ncbi:ubiquitin-conjugating enzyme E2 6 [Trichomonascus vanleenenianus]|uniref:ubiquitin-conjugating enzyme E2 n=1 Tax=Trichomonascus vanleenenianus TaxID=2268995 RepID=UPI003EC9E9D3
MASKAAHKRLTREYMLIQETPTPFITAVPNESNILEWHYVITGPPDTPYENGQYHGTLTFPPDYPFKPPAIRMVTPSGRFKTNMRLCLSISDYHPKTWNPAWSVSTILTGLLSFMVADETTAGSITTTDGYKRQLATESHRWNLNDNPRFREHFPDLITENKKIIEERRSTQAQAHSGHQSVKAKDDERSPHAAPTNPVQSGSGFSLSGRQKVFCVCIFLVSWILAARVFGAEVLD